MYTYDRVYKNRHARTTIKRLSGRCGLVWSDGAVLHLAVVLRPEPNNNLSYPRLPSHRLRFALFRFFLDSVIVPLLINARLK